MLLNYLYSQYIEQTDFCAAANIDIARLEQLQSSGLVPKASYVVELNLQAKSFVAIHQEAQKYLFYLEDQLTWLAQIADKKITTQAAARHYFETQYNLAIDSFLHAELGKKITDIYPQNIWKLSDYSETWGHFLDGTYGLCTRTGLPNEIFLKHIYIGFIEFVTATNRPKTIDPNLLKTLQRAVDALDKVESDFAPHEVAQSSRQRCIIDIKKDYFK